MVGQALASALAQTVPVNVLVQFDREGWPDKFNEIAAASTREWMIPLCDDDLLAPNYVERCLAVSADADIVFTDRRVWHERPRRWYDPRTWRRARPEAGFHFRMFGAQYTATDPAHVTLPPDSFAFGQALPMTCMIRRSLWERMGGYDGTVPHADTELWYRAARDGARIAYVPEPLFWYRYHPDQLSRQVPTQTAALVAFHRKHFLDFGFTFDAPEIDGTQWRVQIIPPEERADYMAKHFTPRRVA